MKTPVGFLFFLLILFLKCSTTHEHIETVERKIIVEKPFSLPYKLLNETKSKHITFDNIQIDSVSVPQKAQGIRLKVDITVTSGALKEVHKLKFPAYYFELGCETDCKLHYTSQCLLKKEQRVHINREYFFSNPGKRTVEFYFPFRTLEMKEGEHELILLVNALPINFKKDSTEAEFQSIEKIGKLPIEYLKLKIKVNAPRLYKTVVQVEKFELNTAIVDPKKFDFSFGGSGYPDLYWSIYCGEDLIFYGPTQMNSTIFDKKSITNTFLCSKKDVLKINFADYDNGPFNTQDDVIETWTGRLDEILEGNYTVAKNSKLKYLKMNARILK